MLFRKPSQSAYYTRSSSSRSSQQSRYSTRCKLFIALIVFIFFATLFRDKESRYYRTTTATTNNNKSPSNLVMEKADHLYRRYMAQKEAYTTTATFSPTLSEVEDEVFKELLVLEEEHLNASPLVEVEPASESESALDSPSVEVEVNDHTVLPSLSTALILEQDNEEGEEVIQHSATIEQVFEEVVEVEGEDDEDDDDDENENPTLSSYNQSLFLSTFIRGGLHYKSVNNHFLSLMDAFKFAGWNKVQLDSSASMFLTKPVTVVPGSKGKMISQISKSSCLGGTKGGQLSCRSKFAKDFHCEFDDLEISPRQFNMWRSEDCTRFFEFALPHADKQWIGKVGASYHGRKITLYTGVTKHIKASYGKCKMNQHTGGGYIMMEYISNPALLNGRKFDLRTFLLVANTKPFLVFYHKGFVRRSLNAYSSDLNDKLAHITNVVEQGTAADHFLGFDDLQKELTSQLGFPPTFMKDVFEPRAKKVTNYVFQAARAAGLKRRTGAFGLFGLDFMIDLNQKIHLLEGNGNPVVQHYPGTQDLTPKVWRDMAQLLTRIHMNKPADAEPLGPLKEGFKFQDGWDLVFSELEEIASASPYNPCAAFGIEKPASA